MSRGNSGSQQRDRLVGSADGDQMGSSLARVVTFRGPSEGCENERAGSGCHRAIINDARFEKAAVGVNPTFVERTSVSGK